MTRSGGPGDYRELSQHFPAERNQALLIKTNKNKKNRFQGASVLQDRLFTPGLGWHSFYFMNWQCVYANILINRENRSPIYLIWGPPSLLEGVRKKQFWKAIYFAGVGS